MRRWVQTATPTGRVADAKAGAAGCRNKWNATPANATFANIERTKYFFALTLAPSGALPEPGTGGQPATPYDRLHEDKAKSAGKKDHRNSVGTGQARSSGFSLFPSS